MKLLKQLGHCCWCAPALRPVLMRARNSPKSDRASSATSETMSQECFWQRRLSPNRKKPKNCSSIWHIALGPTPGAMRRSPAQPYGLLGPSLEMTPSHGRTKEGGVVVKSSCPPNSKWPVALAKRPVPPVTSAVSLLSYTPGVSVGHRYPSKVP